MGYGTTLACTRLSSWTTSRRKNGPNYQQKSVSSFSTGVTTLFHPISTNPITQTTQAIVKETIAGRKNTSPQNVYEVTQLYAAGALKVACVGLQCVGFNNTMYKALLDQAGTFAQSKWKAATPIVGSAGDVLGTGSAWNSRSGAANERDLVDGLGAMNLGRKSAH
jgi:hypothetical protein